MKSEAAAIVAVSPNLTVAAQRLGVDRSTLGRWIRSGKVPHPRKPREAGANPPATGGATFAEWARSVYTLTRGEDELVGLAQQALDLANDLTATPATRLQAMAQFRATLKDLRLPTEDENGQIQTTTVTRFPQRVG